MHPERNLFYCFICLLLVSLAWPAGAEPAVPLADQVIVNKSKRRLYLVYQDSIIREYKIALGRTKRVLFN